MKRLALIVAAVGALFALKKQQDAKKEADLWHEATTAADAGPTGVR